MGIVNASWCLNCRPVTDTAPPSFMYALATVRCCIFAEEPLEAKSAGCGYTSILSGQGKLVSLVGALDIVATVGNRRMSQFV